MRIMHVHYSNLKTIYVIFCQEMLIIFTILRIVEVHNAAFGDAGALVHLQYVWKFY